MLLTTVFYTVYYAEHIRQHQPGHNVLFAGLLRLPITLPLLFVFSNP